MKRRKRPEDRLQHRGERCEHALNDATDAPDKCSPELVHDVEDGGELLPFGI